MILKFSVRAPSYFHHSRDQKKYIQSLEQKLRENELRKDKNMISEPSNLEIVENKKKEELKNNFTLPPSRSISDLTKRKTSDNLTNHELFDLLKIDISSNSDEEERKKNSPIINKTSSQLPKMKIVMKKQNSQMIELTQVEDRNEEIKITSEDIQSNEDEYHSENNSEEENKSPIYNLKENDNINENAFEPTEKDLNFISKKLKNQRMDQVFKDICNFPRSNSSDHHLKNNIEEYHSDVPKNSKSGNSSPLLTDF